MRLRVEIENERAIEAAWQAISRASGKVRDEYILIYANDGAPAVREWVETKFRATLAALRATA